MKGFNNKFENLPDYILKITHQIWEEKDVNSIMEYYAENIPVRSPMGIIYGPNTVVDATNATLDEFPDRQLLGEDVIWIGNEDEGFLSSHRILSKATHVKDGLYGKATNKKLVYRVIADCACKNNQVYDEWLVRDQGAIVRQLEIDPKKYAAILIKQEGGIKNCIKPFDKNSSQETSYAPPILSKNNIADQYAENLENILNINSKSTIEKNYDRSVQQFQPGGFVRYGIDDVTNFWQNLRQSFPDALFRIEHKSFTVEENQPKKVAIRWSLVGKHSGNGIFGQASNSEIYIMGINHAEIGPRGIKNEWVLFDETAIWKQILIKTG